MADDAPKVLLPKRTECGEVAVVELTGGGRPPLDHHDFDETFYVLEGELTFQLGEERLTRRAGEPAFTRRRVPPT
jgi:quercetin dioxygenase-like cupin family protein